MIPVLLVINTGSSSVKFQVFTMQEKLECLALGRVTDLGNKPQFSISHATQNEKKTSKESLAADCTQEQALHLIIDWINAQNQQWTLAGVAHRVVHGGAHFTHSVVVTPQIIQQLKKLNPLAPLHQPHNIAAIEIIRRLNPELPQVACFDTAFHAQHTPLFTTYALPLGLREQGIRRYGFHGLSYEWIAQCLKKEHPNWAKGRVITAHLGNGASLCAMNNGISVDTTMGLTALDGLPMGTRCGSLDPGAITYMIRELGMTAHEVESVLYKDSGLLGLSSLTNNVEELEKSNDDNARFALDYFCLKTAQYIAMMAISLGTIDALVFTGGIGENSGTIRTRILEKIECLQPFSVLVIPTNEEKMMATHALSLLKPRV